MIFRVKTEEKRLWPIRFSSIYRRNVSWSIFHLLAQSRQRLSIKCTRFARFSTLSMIQILCSIYGLKCALFKSMNDGSANFEYVYIHKVSNMLPSILHLLGFSYREGAIFSKRYVKVFLLLSFQYLPVYFLAYSLHSHFLDLDSIHIFDRMSEIRFVDSADENKKSFALTVYKNYEDVENNMRKRNFKSIPNIIAWINFLLFLSRWFSIQKVIKCRYCNLSNCLHCNE